MALELEVRNLVAATTQLSNTVSEELNKVRTENANFKADLATSFNTQRLTASRVSLVSNSYSPIEVQNTGKIGNTICRNYAFFNMKKGEANGGNWDGFALYSYRFTDANTLAPSGVAVPFVIFDNNSVSIGGSQPSAMASDTFAIGYQALTASLQYTSAVGIGASANVTGNNQIQLGNAGMAVYSQNAIQLRSDRRDKTDIRPTVLGLEFIKALKPVDFRWDTRDAYRVPAPTAPTPISEEASESEKQKYESAMVAYNAAITEWQEKNKTDVLKPDGSKKRNRIHHGLIAQDVEELIRSTNQDFGGFQDHKYSGGADVLSIGYTELIAPLIKAVQELAQANQELRGRIETLEARK
jgi:hypothetical protein